MDAIQQHFTDQAFGVSHAALAEADVEAAKARLLDTLAAVVTGFGSEASRLARGLAMRDQQPGGATVIGTGAKSSPDMAAFANAASAGQGISGSHQVIVPLLAAAEHAGAAGRDLVAAIVLADDLHRQLTGLVVDKGAFSATGPAHIAAAIAGGKLLGLSRDQLAECISLAATTDVVLNQTDASEPTMWDRFAAGHAGRAALFAAMTARAGMEGPKRPFEGKTGWCDHVAGGRVEDTGGVAPGSMPSAATDLASAAGKFVDAVGPVIGAEKARAIVEAVTNVESAEDTSAISAACRID